MATIYHLNKSITQMTDEESYNLISMIRANRRNKIAILAKNKVEGKKEYKPNSKKSTKTNLKEGDMFAFIKGMSSEDKARLTNSLLGDL